ncbi:MAG: CHASE domain-containing protein [Pseudomonadota bacterium]
MNTDTPTSPSKRHARFPIFNAWLIFVAALAVTGWSWHALHDHYLQDTRANFDLRAGNATTAIRRGFASYEQTLRGAAGLIATTDKLTQEQWQRYVAELRMDTSLLGAQAIGFAPIVTVGARDAHLQVIHKDVPDYSIWPTSDAPYSTPATYIAPLTAQNIPTRGFDFASDPIRRAAMERAANSGTATVTGKVQLTQGTENNVPLDSLMVLPVYKEGAMPAANDKRQAALLGFVYTSFRLRDLIKGAVGNQLPSIDLEIYEGQKPRTEDLLFATGHSSYHLGYTDQTLFTKSETVYINALPWTFFYATPKDFEQVVGSDASWTVLIGGLAISILAFGTALSSSRSRRQAIVLENRTAQDSDIERK